MGVERHQREGHAWSLRRIGAGRRGLLISGASLAASAGLVLAMPAALGMSWAAIGGVVTQVSVTALLVLTVLWAAGLLVHTVVLTAALPRLGVRRALLLNLSGSAVSNLMPFGGAAGVGLGYLMARRWRIEPERFAAFTAVSNLWNVVGKLVTCSVVLGVVAGLGGSLPSGLSGLIVYSSAAVLVTVATAAAILGSPRLARRFAVEAWLLRLRAATGSVIAAGWGRLTMGVLGYLALQAVLLGGCLTAVGGHPPVVTVAVGFAVERLLSLIPVTPGGAGFAEFGAAGALVALGVDPVVAAAGVLLYRAFTFLLEIPVGGVAALLWLRRGRTAVTAGVS